MYISRAKAITTRSHQLGVGMVEVLVTVFILAVGLLGVASLQFIGSFTNSDAMNRSAAVLVGQELAERLQANSVRSQSAPGLVVNNAYFESEHYNFSGLSCTSSDLWSCHCRSIPASIPNCQTGMCSAAEMAQYDAWELSCSAVKAQPTMRLSLECVDENSADADLCSVGSRYIIMLRWPVESWQANERVLNSRCNESSDTSEYDCVIVELLL